MQPIGYADDMIIGNAGSTCIQGYHAATVYYEPLNIELQLVDFFSPFSFPNLTVHMDDGRIRIYTVGSKV